MRSTSVAAVVLAALLAPLAGCAGTAAGPAPVGPAVTTLPGTPVVLTRTGGIGGLKDTITVEPDGRWTKVDRAGATRTGQLSGQDLDRLRQLAADPRLAAEVTATPATGCADALTYQLTVGAVSTGYVDCPSGSVPPAATTALVELLTRATG